MSGTESVKVVVRCRALNKRELEEDDLSKSGQNQIAVKFSQELNQVSVINHGQHHLHHHLDNNSSTNNNNLPRLFTFDAVYGLDSTTEQIYNEVAFPIVESAFEGYNGTIFGRVLFVNATTLNATYGQTGCGKSFTMQGDLMMDNHTSDMDDHGNHNDDHNRNMTDNKNHGIIQRAFEHILEAVAATKDFKFLLRASYIEIYNDEIHDLLLPTNSLKQNSRLDLKRGIISDISSDDIDHNGVINGLTIMNIQTLKDCLTVVKLGLKNRSVCATLMNSDSSRSHSILTVYIERIRYAESSDQLMIKSTADHQLIQPHPVSRVRRGKLHLVDLAGSERLSRTGAVGDRLKEATKINLSLSALGNVISSVADQAHHIPYRDSKLTRLLQDSLGGNAKTLMIACIAPTMADYNETLCTLSFARRAKSIKNKPVINQDGKDSILESYKIEIDRLRSLLTNLEARQQQQQQPNHDRQLDSDTTPSDLSIGGISQNHVMNNLKQSEQNDKNDGDELRRLSNDFHEFSGDKNELEQCQSLDQMRIKAMERLNKLQSQLVGGERADDEDIKMKRTMRARWAKKKLDALNNALAKLNDDDQKLVKAFGNVSEELATKTEILKNTELRIASLEQEIGELTREFELDRSDMASKIYKQSKEIKFFKQLAEFIFNSIINCDHDYFVNFNRLHQTTKLITSETNTNNNNHNSTTEDNSTNQLLSSQKRRLRTTIRGQQQQLNGPIPRIESNIDDSDNEISGFEPSSISIWNNERILSSSFYSFVQYIRKQSNWSEFEHRWLLPDAQKLQITSDRLPNARNKFEQNNNDQQRLKLMETNNNNNHQGQQQQQQQQQVMDNSSSSKLWEKLQERNSKESVIAYFRLNKTAHLLSGKR